MPPTCKRPPSAKGDPLDLLSSSDIQSSRNSRAVQASSAADRARLQFLARRLHAFAINGEAAPS